MTADIRGSAPKLNRNRECEHGEYAIECGKKHTVHGYAADSLPGMRGGSYATMCGESLNDFDYYDLTSDARLWTCEECRAVL